MAWLPRENGKMEKTRKELESNLKSADEAESTAIAEARKAHFDEDGQNEIGMAVRECTVNAIVHGNRYSAKKKVHLEIDRSEETLTVTIGDEGEGFNIESLPDPTAPENLLRQSGRGILLVRAFMDEFDVHPRPGGGTEVRLVKHVPKS